VSGDIRPCPVRHWRGGIFGKDECQEQKKRHWHGVSAGIGDSLAERTIDRIVAGQSAVQGRGCTGNQAFDKTGFPRRAIMKMGLGNVGLQRKSKQQDQGDRSPS
jgi:hypothetical protein